MKLYSQIAALSLLSAALLPACTATVTPNPQPSATASASASPAPGASASPTPSPAASASPADVNGCTSFVDMTDVNNERKIPWDFPIATDARRCFKVKAGQQFNFYGNFSAHPLVAAGGTTPNPFTGAKDLVSNPGVVGQEYTPLIINTPGTYGFVCSAHPSMKGAVQVVP